MFTEAALAQLGERQTEDLKVPGSIPGGGIFTDLVLWCNWLALRTLNPAIRVQIPVGPLLHTATLESKPASGDSTGYNSYVLVA